MYANLLGMRGAIDLADAREGTSLETESCSPAAASLVVLGLNAVDFRDAMVEFSFFVKKNKRRPEQCATDTVPVVTLDAYDS